MVGLSIGGLERDVDGWRERWGVEGVDQEGLVCEARIPFAALGVEDPERRAPPGRPVAVVGDERLGALADDVAAEADPRPAGQLEPDAGRLGDRGREAAGEPGRIEDEEQGLRASGERGKSMESVGDPARLVRPSQSTAGQVEDEHVDRPTRQERARDAQALVEAGRGDDDEPFEPDPAGHGLDGIEAARQVEPGHDGSGRLRLGRGPQGEGRAPARAVAADRHAGRTGQAAGPEDGIERGEAGVDDPVVGERRGRWERGLGGLRRCRQGRRQSECPDDPRSAAPQRACRPATAASTSPRVVVIGRLD